MLAGTLIVLVLYVALNAVFLHSAPSGELAGQLDVARISGTHIFGEFGGRIVGAMICIGLISSISAMMWIGPRVMMTMGEDIPVLRLFARKSTQRRAGLGHSVPARDRQPDAVHPQFRSRARIHPVRLLFCSFFTVLGVIKLRITRPDLPRPYRAWGYPVTPLVFLLVTGFMMYYLLTEQPLRVFLGVLIMLSGLLIYAVFRKRADQVRRRVCEQRISDASGNCLVENGGAGRRDVARGSAARARRRYRRPPMIPPGFSRA